MPRLDGLLGDEYDWAILVRGGPKPMRKLAGIIGLALGLVLLAAACGGDGEEVPPAATATAAPTEGPSFSAVVTGKIAFTSDRDGNHEVYVMNADGSGQTRLTDNPAADALPAWSPDGSRIAFTSDRDGNPEVYVMNADGSGQTNLTSNPATDAFPAWSPAR